MRTTPLNASVPTFEQTSQEVVATPLTVISGGLKNPSPPKLSTTTTSAARVGDVKRGLRLAPQCVGVVCS